MIATRISKHSMLHASLTKQHQIISDFEREIAHLKKEITMRHETDSQDYGRRAEYNDMLVRLEHELNFLKKELITLQTLKEDEECEKVELGAVVVTDQRIFYISSSVDLLEVNGQSLFGISTKAPIYHAMKGKRVGDFFDYYGVRYQILDVY